MLNIAVGLRNAWNPHYIKDKQLNEKVQIYEVYTPRRQNTITQSK